MRAGVRVRCSGKISAASGWDDRRWRRTQLLELRSGGHQTPGDTRWVSGKEQSLAILGARGRHWAEPNRPWSFRSLGTRSHPARSCRADAVHANYPGTSGKLLTDSPRASPLLLEVGRLSNSQSYPKAARARASPGSLSLGRHLLQETHTGSRNFSP